MVEKVQEAQLEENLNGVIEVKMKADMSEEEVKDTKSGEVRNGEELNGVIEVMVKADMLEEEKDTKNGEVKKGEEEGKLLTEARGELPRPGENCDSSQKILLHKQKCAHLDDWRKAVSQWYSHETPRGSASNELSAAHDRAEKLVKECSDHKNLLLKAVELWECVEHFVEVVLDLCWSCYIICLGNYENVSEWDWMSEFNELLESRREPEQAKWFHKGCSEKDKKDLADIVARKLLDRTLTEKDPEHELAQLLYDRLHGKSQWRPPFLQKHPFSIFINLVVPSARSSKTGAQGAVLRVEWVYGRAFALKMRHPKAHDRISFQDEFNKLHRYRSPYIVGVVGYWEVEAKTSYNIYSRTTQQPFLLMEYLDYDLQDLMVQWEGRQQSRGFSELETIHLMLPIAKALRFLHGKDVVHRDVKPRNIMCKLNAKSTGVKGHIVKLVDFGEAMENASKPPKDISGRAATPAGTPGYMDPTMKKLKKNVVGYSLFMGDVFSFAMVFTELLTWRSPKAAFEVLSPQRAQEKLEDGQRPPLPNGTSEYVRFIVESCWHADHLKRPDFNAVCSMLQYAKFLLTENDLEFDPKDFFSYEDAGGVNRCMRA